jgi:single-stranded DNA-binding protein
MASGNDEVIQVVGNAGGDPEYRTDSTGNEWANFSVAVTKSYANKLTTWVRVGTKNPGLVQFIKDNIRKATPVAAEGFMKVEQYNGKTQYNLLGTRIGIVKYGVKSDTQQSNASKPEGDGFQWG